jgi:ADP-ribosylglycohydrolase
MLGALWGALCGDALGVPVEFLTRETIGENPVVGMRGFGTHNQPPGTWSDDSSLLLCTAESLAENGEFNPKDLGERFVRWDRQGHWTPHGRVFDIGIATSQALGRIAAGTPPEEAGGADEQSNGNGSLMRILPVALWFGGLSSGALAEYAMRASALTHRHLRSRMACAFYCLLVRELVGGAGVEDAIFSASSSFSQIYAGSFYAAERPRFELLLDSGRLRSLPVSKIVSSGYVMDTLTASLWCLLTSNSLEETVLKAVNLGFDTDTTGTVAGGLAGARYGLDAIPAPWMQALARRQEVESLFMRFVSYTGVSVAKSTSPR